MPRKPASKIDIDVVPYLSIMVIVLKLICLILVVLVMKIALNPQGIKAVTISGMYAKESKNAIKVPTYFDCSPDGLAINQPGISASTITVLPSELAIAGNAAETTIRHIRDNASNEYVIAVVRPRGIRVYRHVRKLILDAGVDIGVEVFDGDVKIKYAEAAKDAGVQVGGAENAQDQKR